METKKENGAVDIAKLIMALLVIIIHKPLFKSDFLNYMSGAVICSVAVPFFFIASAYFFFFKINKTDEDNRRLLNFEKRLFKLYLIWTIIYLPCIFVKYNTGQYELMTLKIFCGQILVTVKNFFLSTSFVHFWYINTLMLSVAVIFFLCKKLDYKAVIAICILVTVISRTAALLDPERFMICRIYGYIPSVICNTFEKGLFCTAGGLLLSRMKFKSKSLEICIAVAVVSMTALVINGYYTFMSESELLKYPLFFLACLFSLALMGICLNIYMKPSKMYAVIRKYSTLMYFSHLLLMSEGFRYISEKTGIRGFTENNLMIYFTTVAFAVLISTLIIWLSKKEKLKILKNLY